jgi:hypothetical protein
VRSTALSTPENCARIGRTTRMLTSKRTDKPQTKYTGNEEENIQGKQMASPPVEIWANLRIHSGLEGASPL